MTTDVLTVDITLREIISIVRGANAANDPYIFRRLIDDWYYKCSEEARIYIFDTVVREVYGKCFLPNPLLGGVDKLFLSRFNPGTQVLVEYTTADGKHDTANAFVSEGKYYLSSYETIPNEVIVKTEYI